VIEKNITEETRQVKIESQTDLINKIRMQITSKTQSRMDANAVGGRYSERESFSSQSTAESSAEIVGMKVETYIDQKAKLVYAFAYAAKDELIGYYKSNLSVNINQIEGLIQTAQALEANSEKSKARRQLETAQPLFSKVRYAQDLLIAIDGSVSADDLLQTQTETLYNQFAQMQARMAQAVYVYVESHEDLFGKEVDIVANKLKSELALNGCSFVENTDTADFSLNLTATTRTSDRYAGMVFCYADVIVVLYDLHKQKAVYSDEIAQKGGSNSQEKAGRQAMSDAAQKITEKLIPWVRKYKKKYKMLKNSKNLRNVAKTVACLAERVESKINVPVGYRAYFQKGAKMLFFVCLLFFGLSSAYSQENKKEKVIIIPFNYARTVYDRTVSLRLAELADNVLTSVLHGTGRFIVVERSLLNKVLDEQKFSQSDLVTDEDAINFGQLSGASYAVTGSITNVAYNTKEDSYRNRDGSTTRRRVETGSMGLHIKVIDVSTGELFFTKSYDIKSESSNLKGSETFLPDILSNKIKGDVQRDVKNLFPVAGSILFIDGKKSVTIDIGSEYGVKKGLRLEVVRTEERTNSAGKTVRITKKIAKLQIVNVTGEDTAECKIVDGKITDLEEGMRVVTIAETSFWSL
jgi:curli biogenesis system outer membrane secretion channel CsgG